MSEARLRFMLWAQRRGTALPAPVRRVVGRALARLRPIEGMGPGPIEDWSIPLLPGREGGNIELLKPAEPSRQRRREPVGGAEVTQRRLRCVVATDVLDVGGMDEFVVFLGRRLPGAGVETVVAYAGIRKARAPGEGGRGVRALEESGVPTVQLSPTTCRDWLASYRPDVVSAHAAPVWLLDAAVELGIPWVDTLHGLLDFLDPSSWPAERLRAPKVSAQIAVSDLVRRQYLARIPDYPPDRVVTIPNGFDEERVVQMDRAAARAALGLRDEFLFVSLSRYCLVKNVFGLVAAFTDVAAAHPDTHLLVAGRADDARYFAQVRTLAESSPYADRIHLRGHCANPAALLAAADAFALNSFSEGWSLASMEALATGTPVVMSDVGGAREQLGFDGTRGRLVGNPLGDAETVSWRSMGDVQFDAQGNRADVVAAMSAVVAERDRWAADRSRLRQESRKRFSADVCVRRHVSVLRAVAYGEPVPDFSAALTA